MTRVIFYSNLTDKQIVLSTLIHQALVKSHLVTVMVKNEQEAEQCNQMLWQRDPISFLPSVLASHVLTNVTPVVIDWQQKQLCQDDILINLSETQLNCFSRYRQLIELVGVDEQEKVLARQRFKFYRDRGYDIKHFNQASLMQ